MTNIDDLQERISSAEAVLDALKTELQELKNQEQQQEPEPLFGRWATHPEHGRGIIASDNPDTFKEVLFTIRNDEFTDGADQLFVRFDDLTLDPATLNGEQDFDRAPGFTIVEDIDDLRCVAVKVGGGWHWGGEANAVPPEGMPPCRVIRWGNGQ